MISIAWATGVITVSQAFMTPLGGSTYELDLDAFRLALKDLEDDEAGMPWPRTHNHSTVATLAGIAFARSVEIVTPYRVQFEDGIYGVNVVGGNSNIPDVLIRNSVSVNTQNSAGLVLAPGVDQASVQLAMSAQGYTEARAPKLDRLDVAVSSVAAAVMAEIVEGTITLAQSVRIMNAILSGKVTGAGTGTEAFRDPGDTKNRVVVTVDGNGNRTAIARDLT